MYLNVDSKYSDQRSEKWISIWQIYIDLKNTNQVYEKYFSIQKIIISKMFGQFLKTLTKDLKHDCRYEKKLRIRKKQYIKNQFSLVGQRYRTKYEEIRSISRYSVHTRENTNQNNSEYGHFWRSVIFVDLR